jgi:hypothetical protein
MGMRVFNIVFPFFTFRNSALFTELKKVLENTRIPTKRPFFGETGVLGFRIPFTVLEDQGAGAVLREKARIHAGNKNTR